MTDFPEPLSGSAQDECPELRPKFNADGLIAAIAQDGESMAAYRVVQEALTNIMKHAGPAARAIVKVRYRPDQIIVEVLDTIDRAREHEEVTGGFKSVVDQLERTVAAAGLTRFGAPGDAFDPTLHEALSHIGEDPDVEVTTCKVIAKAGYRIGERVVRAAQVLVVDPAGS